jgi:hypothetical protein
MLVKWFNAFRKTFGFQTDKEYAHAYLSESVSHADLERRMKDLEKRGIYFY